MAIDPQTRSALIRKANELFNEGHIKEAYRVYATCGYAAGIEKIADYYYFQKNQPIIALGYYREAGGERAQDKMTEIYGKMIGVLKQWINEDGAPAAKPAAPAKVSAKSLTAKQKRNARFEKGLDKPHFYSR